MAALPYMQLYVADYLADTPHLTTEEHGAYLLLLFSYWQTGKPLRVDRLSSAARLSNERWTDVQRTLKEFFKEVDGVWIHLRVEKDLEKVATKSGKNSEAGKASAAARALAKQQLERLASEGNSANVGTSVERPLNERSTIEDTDTDTDTEDQKHLSSSLDGEGARKKRHVDQTPYQEILDCYMNVCGGKFLGAEVLNAKRKKNIKRTYDLVVRGSQPFKDRGIEFWQKYFARCVTNRHWCGDNDRGWKADLEFVTREENVLKVLGV